MGSLKVGPEILPLISPVDHYHLASRFGMRRDPFTKRHAMHYGLDLAGWKRAPVFATAEGVVVYSGQKAVTAASWRSIMAMALGRGTHTFSGRRLRKAKNRASA